MKEVHVFIFVSAHIIKEFYFWYRSVTKGTKQVILLCISWISILNYLTLQDLCVIDANLSV